MCGPRGLSGEADHLFHNNGDGTFTDVNEKAGASDRAGYYGLAAVFVDVDDDGWVDLAVADGSTPNYLYHNRQNGTFEDVSYASGFALSEDGREQASMGIGVGDYNRDGRVDLFTTTFSDDYRRSIEITAMAIVLTSPIRLLWAIPQFRCWLESFVSSRL
jgi:hypothetical protein